MSKIKVKDFGDKLVAVYGTLREGWGNNERLSTSEKLGTVDLAGFGMVGGWGFPYAYPTEEDKSIKIEVWRPNAEDNTRQRLDDLEGYPTHYDRQIVDTEFGEAWIYFSHHHNNESPAQIEHGDWNKHYQERKGTTS